jgi:tRNA A-37 threonylcarbamoyl transferase component Bud32
MPDRSSPEQPTLAPAAEKGKQAPPAASPPPSEAPTLAPDGPGPPPSETVAGAARETMAQQASLVGLEFEDFVLLEELGRGGMGVVYKARQKSLDRLVALKLLRGDHFSKPTLQARFLAEARAAAGLSHPNIVSIYQVGQCPAGQYFAMEFIDGPDLEELTARDGRARPMPVSWAVSIMIPVAQAVAFAHTRGIVHRDLKPANIMIDVHKRPLVMDFGIAKVIGRSTGLTVQGAILGTPAYMAPEQAGDDPEKVGPHSDVYSLGAILYRLLTGRPTYTAQSPLLTLLQVIAPEMPAPVRQLRPEVPEGLEQVVMKCLAKSPAQRYPSAKAVALALAQELTRLRAQPAAPAAAPEAPAPAKERPVPQAPEIMLVVEKTGREIRLKKPVNMLGRSAGCEVRFKAADVSKQHCRIALRDGTVMVEDLCSANGTFVNGQAIRSAVLKDGDVLRVGNHSFRVRLLKSAT